MTNKRQTTGDETTKQPARPVWASGVCRLSLVLFLFVCDLVLGIWCFGQPINPDFKAAL
jgi:hypothetical protein